MWLQEIKYCLEGIFLMAECKYRICFQRPPQKKTAYSDYILLLSMDLTSISVIFKEENPYRYTIVRLEESFLEIIQVFQ